MFKAAGIQPPNQTLYTRVHGHYAAPAVSRYWDVVNQPILDRLSQEEDRIVLLGEYRTILSNIMESKWTHAWETPPYHHILFFKKRL